MKTDPLISVVMPMYNVGQFVAEAIDSVVAQSIGFTDNIELILVDDGSTDDTETVCRPYIEQYPDNVHYIRQPNKGVSASRNAGLRLASGRYINFFDADDVWSKDAFRHAAAFLGKHQTVDFVASKIKFFEGTIDSHPSNYKFRRTRVIDLAKEPDNPIFHIVTCLFKREAIAGRSFDERLPISEDVKLLSEILLDKKAYGVLRKPTYYYRKRADQGSAIGGKTKNKAYYTTAPRLAYLPMSDAWRDATGRIEAFMQYQLLSDIYWRLQETSQNILTSQEAKEYRQLIYRIICELDDSVILNRRGLELEYKVYLLKVKHQKQYASYISERGGTYYFNDMYLCKARDMTVHVDFLHNNEDGTYVMEGRLVPAVVDAVGGIEARTTRDNVPIERTERAQQELRFLGDVVSDGGGFRVELPIDDGGSLSFTAASLGETRTGRLKLSMRQFSGLSTLNYSYARKQRQIVRRQFRRLVFSRLSLFQVVRFELLYLLRILTYWRLRDAAVRFAKLRRRNLRFLRPKAKAIELAKPFFVIAETVLLIPRAILLRVLYFTIKPLVRRPIWLVSDRVMAAGDNGEALFRYIKKQSIAPANVYFVIAKQSDDYSRMAQYGKVLDQGSMKYKLLFLLSDMVISSHADIETTNPFIRQIDHYVDLFDFKFVFLQHGIIKDDLSEWLNRFDTNASLFITSSQREYESLFRYPYYYSKDEVLLSGLPRYDLLESRPKGKLIIAPTYRANLLRTATNKQGVRPYDATFSQSAYFQFYNQLINDKRILKALAKHNMTGELYLHPNFAAQVSDFQSNSMFKMPGFPYDYKKIFREGSILVSDYSTTTFDFAYLKKPVVYTQFDAKEFYSGQIYRPGDFFGTEGDGFGPVAYDYETAVRQIIEILEAGCVMEPKYQKRVDKFFAYKDKNNSRRVYEGILAMRRNQV